MNTNRSSRVVGIILAVLVLPAAAQAVVRYVALDGSGAGGQSWATAYKTIQAAINDPAVGAGDEIWVKRGTYAISMPILVNKAVKVYGGFSGAGSTRDWQSFPTTVDGGLSAKHCFEINANAHVDGFTVTRGSAWGLNPYGGGMYIVSCSATVTNCIFFQNESMEWGGGLATRWADGATIANCVFTENISDYTGGGMHNYESSPTVTGCTFENNKTGSDLEGWGGGVMNAYGAPVISNCSFTANSAEYGAGLSNYYSDAVIENCTFADCNQVTIAGGGIYSFQGAPTIRNCLFQRNNITGKGAALVDQSGAQVINCVMWNNSSMRDGGAIYIDWDDAFPPSTAHFINCTIAKNRASRGGGLYSYSSAATLSNCIVWGNQAYISGPGIYNYTLLWPAETLASYSDIEGDVVYPGAGNIRVDPEFANPLTGDFQVPFGSPCVDTGDNSRVTVEEDYAGNPRIVDGDEDGTATVDMGAFEFEGRPNPMKRGEIMQSIQYENPSDTSPLYVFTLIVEGQAAADHIEFQAPGGSTVYTIPSTPHTVSGSIETFHRLDGSTHVWEYWGRFTSPTSLAAYGDGVYRVKAFGTSGPSPETYVSYLLPGTSSPIPIPTQKPQVTAPAYGAAAGSPVTLTWNACTDGNANAIFLVVIDSDTDEEVVLDAFAKTATSSGAYTLSEGMFDAEVTFAGLYDTTSTNGTPFQLGKAMLMGHRFEVPYTAVYRFWSPATGRHFYTVKEAEKDKLINQYGHVWTFEGPVYNACSTAYRAGLVPVYRFWSGQSHFYTISESEKDKLVNEYSHVWTFEGTAFYAFPEGAQPAECQPVYRFWKAADNTHFYTISETERNKLINEYSHVYTDEGVAFYAYP